MTPYPRNDSNVHGLRQQILSLHCIPISALGLRLKWFEHLSKLPWAVSLYQLSYSLTYPPPRGGGRCDNLLKETNLETKRSRIESCICKLFNDNRTFLNIRFNICWWNSTNSFIYFSISVTCCYTWFLRTINNWI